MNSGLFDETICTKHTESIACEVLCVRIHIGTTSSNNHGTLIDKRQIKKCTLKNVYMKNGERR